MLPTTLRDLSPDDFAFCVMVLRADNDARARHVRHVRGIQPTIDVGDP